MRSEGFEPSFNATRTHHVAKLHYDLVPIFFFGVIYFLTFG